ncbi:MAG TPA: DNA adenine methylase, partial [Candidatus Wallbacteria bacterium]|nr:DNA adenine methylase [Candidatus Wallbacteria bacterium]
TYLPKLPANTIVYCDPPYFSKSEKLYQNHYTPDDHKKISRLIQDNIEKFWVVSYDNNPAILDYYNKRKKFTYSIQYNASKTYIGSEVFIFSDDLKIPSKSSLKFINNSLESIIK